MEDSELSLILMSALLLVAVFGFAWAVPKLGRRWDEYDERHRPNPDERSAADGTGAGYRYRGTARYRGDHPAHWSWLAGVSPRASFTVGRKGLKLVMPGFSTIRPYDTVRLIGVSRFGSLTFTFEDGKHRFSFAAPHPSHLIGRLRERGVTVPDDVMRQIAKGERRYSLLMALIFVLVISPFTIFRIMDGEWFMAVYWSLLYPTLLAIISYAKHDRNY